MSKNVVSFHYTLKNAEGQVLDSSEGGSPLSYLEGAGQIIPGLENRLSGFAAGHKSTVVVPSAEAYGDRVEGLVVKVARSKLPTQEIKIGDRFRGGPEEHAPIFVVTDLTLEEATLDANHPLAGQDLCFDVEIVEVRAATEDELQHGHSHGEGGAHSH